MIVNDFSNILTARLKKALQAVYELEPSVFLSLEEREITRRVTEEYSIETPRLDFDHAYRDPPIDYTDSAGRRNIQVRVVVPIQGDGELLPQHGKDGIIYATAIIEQGMLFLKYSQPASNSHVIEGYVRLDRDYFTGSWNPQIEGIASRFNATLASQVREAIAERKANLARTAQTMERTGIPLKRAPTQVAEVVIPSRRRRSAAEVLQEEATRSGREYTLPDGEYEYILSVLERMVDVMERSPRTFARMQEPELRDILLVSLNGHYDHGATGETFNCSGKTDIFLRYEGRAAFIAECKIWKGEAELNSAIDQLLSYTTWRDTKVALLVFNRGRRLTTVINNITKAVPKHSQFVRMESCEKDTQFRYVFRHPSDPEREVLMRTMIFEVPSVSN